jgi:hypothetical protein
MGAKVKDDLKISRFGNLKMSYPKEIEYVKNLKVK